MKTPVNKTTLRQHWSYSWWKYFLLIALAIVGWNLIYTMTAYRPPANKKVDFYLSSAMADQNMLDEYLENIRVTEMPDMEEMSSVVLTTDEYYGTMQLATYIAAGEGDVYLLTADTFQQYATSGAMLVLEDYEDLLAQLDAVGLDADKGWRTESDSGERHLYGIPASSLTGFEAYSVDPEDMYLCVMVNCGNNDMAVQLLQCMVRDMQPSEEEATPTDLATESDLATATDAQ